MPSRQTHVRCDGGGGGQRREGTRAQKKEKWEQSREDETKRGATAADVTAAWSRLWWRSRHVGGRRAQFLDPLSAQRPACDPTGECRGEGRRSFRHRELQLHPEEKLLFLILSILSHETISRRVPPAQGCFQVFYVQQLYKILNDTDDVLIKLVFKFWN